MKSLRIAVVLLSVVLSGCGIHSYAPGVFYLPSNPEKGEIHTTASLGVGGVNVSGGYAINKNIGVLVSTHSNLRYDFENEGGDSLSRQRRNIIELSGYKLFGTDENSNRSGIVFGGGTGWYRTKDKATSSGYKNLLDGTAYVDSKINFNHFFVSPYFTLRTDRRVLEFSIGSRFTLIYYSTYKVSYDFRDGGLTQDFYSYSKPGLTALCLEPFFKLSLGNDFARFFVQTSIPVSFKRLEGLDQQKVVNDRAVPLAQVGVFLRFQTAKKQLLH